MKSEEKNLEFSMEYEYEVDGMKCDHCKKPYDEHESSYRIDEDYMYICETCLDTHFKEHIQCESCGGYYEDECSCNGN